MTIDMPNTIQFIDETTFGQMRAEWNDLLSQSVSDNVFLRWEWIHTWWTHFNQNRELFLMSAREDGRLVGIAPFYIERNDFLGTRRLKMCSNELSPDYLDLIVEKGHELDVTRDFIQALFRNRRRWDVIDLDNVRAESSLLASPSLLKGYSPSVRVSQFCPYLKIEGTFEQYYNSRPKLNSFSLEKKVKKLRETLHATRMLASDQATVDTGLSYLFLLHEKRAAEKNITTEFLQPEIKRFHQDVCSLFLQEKILNLQIMSSGGSPICVRYGFTYKNKVYCFQSGYDPAWSKYSIGAVMIYLMIKRAFEDGTRELDFLKGSESYKQLWISDVRTEMQLIAYNHSLRGFAWLLWHRLKPILHRIKTWCSRRPQALPLKNVWDPPRRTAFD
jgi:CelD/BcsL family acetyltransferase involved in cellulose biosynthesis